jgi:hypothetical protein
VVPYLIAEGFFIYYLGVTSLPELTLDARTAGLAGEVYICVVPNGPSDQGGRAATRPAPATTCAVTATWLWRWMGSGAVV